MTTREQIEKEVRKHVKMTKLTKLIGFIGMSLVFGFLTLFWQGVSYEMINNRVDEIKYMKLSTQDTTSSKVIQFMNSTSEDMAIWIHAKYTYLDSVSSTLGGIVLIGSSLLVAMILVYLFFVPMFGSNDRWFYDKFDIKFTVNGKSATVNGKESKEMIKGLRIISDIEDLGDTYKFKATTYNLIGIPGTEEFEVEKWKVTDKINKWKLW